MAPELKALLKRVQNACARVAYYDDSQPDSCPLFMSGSDDSFYELLGESEEITGTNNDSQLTIGDLRRLASYADEE